MSGAEGWRGERRSRWLLAVVLLSQLILLASQVDDPRSGDSRLEAAVLRVVAPLGLLVDRTAERIERASSYFSRLSTLRADNRRLRQRTADLERQLAALHGIEGEYERLVQAVGYAQAQGAPLLVADIVYLDPGSWQRSLVLLVEEGEVEVGQPVVAEAGLVGRVVLLAGRYAKVQLITDSAAAVGAMVARTRRQGLLRGDRGGRLTLDLVPLQEEVRVGDRILTAGIDGYYPRGIPLGTVSSVEPGDELFHRIVVAPAVEFALLDQVYVLDRQPLPEELRRGATDARP